MADEADGREQATPAPERSTRTVELTEGLRKGGDLVNPGMPDASRPGRLDMAPVSDAPAASADSSVGDGGSGGATGADGGAAPPAE